MENEKTITNITQFTPFKVQLTINTNLSPDLFTEFANSLREVIHRAGKFIKISLDVNIQLLLPKERTLIISFPEYNFKETILLDSLLHYKTMEEDLYLEGHLKLLYLIKYGLSVAIKENKSLYALLFPNENEAQEMQEIDLQASLIKEDIDKDFNRIQLHTKLLVQLLKSEGHQAKVLQITAGASYLEVNKCTVRIRWCINEDILDCFTMQVILWVNGIDKDNEMMDNLIHPIFANFLSLQYRGS